MATASWEEGFGHLEAYVAANGTAQVPARYGDTASGFRLGGWVSKQRDMCKKGQVSKDRVARLEALPGWTWDLPAGAFEKGFQHLLNHLETHGTAKLSAQHKDPVSGFKLGLWVTSRRQEHRLGRLPADRKVRLEALPGWTWDVVADAFEEGFQHLTMYVDAHGTARVSDLYEAPGTGFGLGSWVGKQRQQHRRGRLATDRVIRLEALPGWTWDPYSDAFEEGLRHLVKHVETHGTAKVQQSYVVPEPAPEFGLGRWVHRQRQQHRHGRLAPDRVTRLEALPGWTWDARPSSGR